MLPVDVGTSPARVGELCGEFLIPAGRSSWTIVYEGQRSNGVILESYLPNILCTKSRLHCHSLQHYPASSHNPALLSFSLLLTSTMQPSLPLSFRHRLDILHATGSLGVRVRPHVPSVRQLYDNLDKRVHHQSAGRTRGRRLAERS